jgi:hypothetical protein
MSTTPTPSSPPPPPHKRIRLAPIAVVLVVIIIIAFGVCAANLNFEGPAPPITNVAVCIEVACVIGLIVLAVIGVTRS